uniref:Cleavage and polyadenylation specificity factor subunit 6 n=1 Tax=Macrostomum lignano TaxID=282301 RepID=A0A1I8GJZ4_9PLAT
QSSSYSRKVAMYVGNLTWWTTDEDILASMQELGVSDIVEIKFHENRQNGQSKGFCVLVVGSEQSSRTVMDRLPKMELHGQQPMVTHCNKQTLQYFEQQAGGGRGDRDGGGQSGSGGRSGSGREDRDGGGQQGMQQRDGYRGAGMMLPPGGPHMPPQQGMPPGSQAGGPPPQGMVMPGGRPPGMPGMPPGMPPQQGGPQPHGGMPPPGPATTAAPHINPAFFPRPPMPPGGGPPGMPPQQQPGGPGQQPPGMMPGGPPQLDMFGRPIAPGSFMPHQQQHPPSSMAGPGGPGGVPVSSSGVGMPPASVAAAAGLSESDAEEMLARNKTVCSSAISRAVQDAAAGDYAAAIETLVTAISLIKQSKLAGDDRCAILINSLQDTLHGIESKSYGTSQKAGGRSGGGGGGGGRSSSRRRRSYSRSGSEELDDRVVSASKRSRSRSRRQQQQASAKSRPRRPLRLRERRRRRAIGS